MSSKDKAAEAVEAQGVNYQDWTRPFTPGRLALFVMVLVFVQYPELALGTHSLFDRDFGLFTYPAAAYLRQSLHNGEIPLWNPYIHCGTPFLAQWNTSLCYPPTWLCAIVPLPWSLNCLCLAHLVLAGAGMYALAYNWTGNRLAASLAGLVFALNGLIANCLMWISNLAAISWMPLTILLVERAWRRGGRSMAWASVVGCLQMLSGAPEIIALTWLLLATLWVGQLLSLTLGLVTPTRRFLTMILLVCCLSAVQLLPFCQLLMQSDRETQGGILWSMPLWGWANLVAPLFRCSQTRFGQYIQVDQQWTSSYYFGITTIALAMAAVWKVRTKRVAWLASVAFAGLVLALGAHTPLYGVLIHVFPALALARYPIKYIVLTVFAMPLLAAFAIAWLQASRNTHAEAVEGNLESLAKGGFRAFFIPAALLLVILLAVLLTSCLKPYPYESWRVTVTNGGLRGLFLILSLAAVLMLARAMNNTKALLLGLSLLALTGMDLITHTARQNPTVPVVAFDPSPPAMSPLPQLGQSRAMLNPATESFLENASTSDPLAYYIGVRHSLFKNCNLLDSIPKVRGFTSLHLKEEPKVMALIDAKPFPSGLADFLGVAWESAPDALFKWDPRTNALAWTTAGQRAVFADETSTLRALADPAFDPHAVVYLPLEAERTISATNSTEAKVISARVSAEQWIVDAETPQPAVVVFAQSFAPSWMAFLDGKPAPLLRANLAFQAVQMPSGRHTIRLVYRDEAFRLGCLISAGALLVCIAVWLKGRHDPRLTDHPNLALAMPAQ